MPVRVDFPIRISVDPIALAERQSSIREAVRTAAERALVNAREIVLEARGGYVDVLAQAPHFVWTGAGLSSTPAAIRDETEQILSDVITAAIENAGTYQYRDANENACPASMESAAELFDDNRANRLLRLYKIHSYDDPEREEYAEFEDEMVLGYEAQRYVGWHVEAYHHPSTLDMQRINTLYDAATWEFGSPPPVGWVGIIWRTGSENELAVYFQQRTGRRPRYLTFVLGRLMGAELEVNTPDPSWRDILVQLPPPAAARLRQYGPFEPDQRESVINRFDGDRIRSMLRDAQPRTADVDERLYEERIEVVARREISRRAARYIPEGQSSVIQLQIETFTGTYFFPYDSEVVWEGDAYLLPVTKLESPQMEVEGTSGVSGHVGEGEGLQRVGRGRRPGFATSEQGGEGSAAYFPSARATGGEALACEQFGGEPPLAKLGADADRLRSLMEEIAFKLRIQPCQYAGAFCLFAAYALGARAAGVAEFFASQRRQRRLPTKADVRLTRDENGELRVVRGNTGNLGAVEFEPSGSPAIQFMRHLAGVTPLITRLSVLTQRVYANHEDKFQGRYGNRFENWRDRFLPELDDRKAYSAGVIFGRSCQVLLLQLLLSSRVYIVQRQGSDAYARNFERAIFPQLQDVEELIKLRDSLRGFNGFLAYIRSHFSRHPQHVDDCLRIWLEGGRVAPRCGSLIASASGYPRAYLEAYVNRTLSRTQQEGIAGPGTIILDPDNPDSCRIRDQRGSFWTLEELEYAIPSLRGIAEFFDPVVKQLINLPEEMAHFRALGVEEALRRLLGNMLRMNGIIENDTRDSWMYAFRASKIHEDLRGPTIQNTNYRLRGIHRVAHEQIGDRFEGDHSYSVAINNLFGMEQGFEELSQYSEDVLSIGLAAIAAVCPPMEAAELAFELTTGLLRYAEAQERARLYGSLLHPEQVLTREEVEIELFVARFALKLQVALGAAQAIGSVWKILGRAGLLGKAASEGGRGATRVVGGQSEQRAIQQARTLLERSMIEQARTLTERFVIAALGEALTDQLLNPLLQQLMTPVIRRIARETMIVGPVGGIEGMRRTLAMLRAERALREQGTGSTQAQSLAPTVPQGGGNGD